MYDIDSVRTLWHQLPTQSVPYLDLVYDTSTHLSDSENSLKMVVHISITNFLWLLNFCLCFSAKCTSHILLHWFFLRCLGQALGRSYEVTRNYSFASNISIWRSNALIVTSIWLIFDTTVILCGSRDQKSLPLQKRLYLENELQHIARDIIIAINNRSMVEVLLFCKHNDYDVC